MTLDYAGQVGSGANPAAPLLANRRDGEAGLKIAIGGPLGKKRPRTNALPRPAPPTQRG